MEEKELCSIKDKIVAECKMLVKAEKDHESGGSDGEYKKTCLTIISKMKILQSELKSMEFTELPLKEVQMELLNYLQPLSRIKR